MVHYCVLIAIQLYAVLAVQMAVPGRNSHAPPGTSIHENALYSEQGCQQEKVDKDLVSRACEGI
jgi:hypothetical protein